MSIKTPRLTRDRCGVFYIRLVVPKALRADIGKSELRRSLRTKDCSIAKQRALTLNLALEAALTNPKISDFEHLFNSPEVTTRKAMTIDFERGFFHADTPEEGQALQSIVASYASNRANAVKEQITEIMPVNKCGTSLQTAKFRYFMERIKTLKKSTYSKQLGVVGAFAKMTGNIDIGLITALTVADYKIRLLEDSTQVQQADHGVRHPVPTPTKESEGNTAVQFASIPTTSATAIGMEMQLGSLANLVSKLMVKARATTNTMYYEVLNAQIVKLQYQMTQLSLSLEVEKARASTDAKQADPKDKPKI